MISIPIPTEFPWFFPTNSPSPRPCSTLCAPWNSSKTVWIQRSFLPPRRWFLLFWWDDASNFHGFYDILLGFIWVLFGFYDMLLGSCFFFLLGTFCVFLNGVIYGFFHGTEFGFFTMTWWGIKKHSQGEFTIELWWVFSGWITCFPILAFPWVAPGKPSFMTNGLPSGKHTITMENHHFYE